MSCGWEIRILLNLLRINSDADPIWFEWSMVKIKFNLSKWLSLSVSVCFYTLGFLCVFVAFTSNRSCFNFTKIQMKFEVQLYFVRNYILWKMTIFNLYNVTLLDWAESERDWLSVMNNQKKEYIHSFISLQINPCKTFKNMNFTLKKLSVHVWVGISVVLSTIREAIATGWRQKFIRHVWQIN